MAEALDVAAMDVAALSDEDKLKLKNVMKRVKFCLVCSGGSICYEGWSHKSRTKHGMRALTVEEKRVSRFPLYGPGPSTSSAEWAFIVEILYRSTPVFHRAYAMH